MNPSRAFAGARLRVDNLHYDLSEEDLEVYSPLYTHINQLY